MIDLNKIPECEKTPLVISLIQMIRSFIIELQSMRDEIARLKKQKGKPKIPPSRLEKDPEEEKEKEKDKKDKKKPKKRPGSKKRNKTEKLTIHETIPVPPKDLPPGSKLIGSRNWFVQGLIIQAHNVCYQLEKWKTPDGKVVSGALPDSVNGHFDTMLRSFILQQHHQCHVTQPLILEELRDIGVDISAGQVNQILTEKNDAFHAEKDQILAAGLEVSDYIQVDDTGARHDGKNGYCTHIGNSFFAWFKSTGSKSRLNFLNLLQAGRSDYVVNKDAVSYMRDKKLTTSHLENLENSTTTQFESEADWEQHLKALGIETPRHIKIATEGALLGSILHHGFSKELVIISDDAGQFNILLHALCWVHAERTIHKLIGCSEEECTAIEQIRDRIWMLYRGLKAYKEKPDPQTKHALEKQFDEIFATQTCSEVLDAALARIAKNKTELLLVLERPDIPLHNNLSESDIREYVKKRKISGGTRSENGRKSRDTFISLKKTCRKLGVSYWDYLKDRLSKSKKISPLPELIRDRAQSG